MHFLFLIPSFIIFLYYIYKLVKDDYVFIRKNISLEQVFDIAFIVTWISLFFSRLFFFIFHPLHIHNENIFMVFFSPRVPGLSFFGFVVGSILGLYVLGKYKKIPLGRLFDFFTLAFVAALPLGFASLAMLVEDFQLLITLGNALVYFIFTLFCLKYVHPKVASREFKEGNLQVIFLLFFAIVSLINATLLQKEGEITFLTTESIVSFVFFLISIILFVKQARGGFINKKR